jgi:hypothetical protein
MRNLTNAELAGIANRAELAYVYGDRDALTAQDVADLIQEVRELHALRDHLMAMNRQAQDRLSAIGEANGGQAAAPIGDVLELDPP